MGKIIGIDLGTTNSCVAIMEGKEPKVVNNEEGARTTPSVVAYAKDGQILVGQTAKRQAITNPENTIFSAKRFIGIKFNEAGQISEQMPYKVFQASNGDAHIEANSKQMAPPEISAKVLQKLKTAAERYLGEDVTEAVITVPAYFNDSQRQATKDAGKIAGLDVKRIINEPTAAALAYGLDQKKDKKIAVYDLGGGTFDISILDVGDGVVEVCATNGDTQLGGDDIDNILIKYLIEEFKKDQGIDVSADKMVLQRLKEAAEKVKIELSSTTESEVNLPFLTADASGPKHLNLKLSRAKFESMIEAAIDRSIEPCRKALADSKLKVTDIDEVVLVGGSTRIPLVQEKVKKFFNKEPHHGVNPDEVVALGAAIQGGVLSGDVSDILLLDVTPLSLGIETLGGVNTKLIERNTTIPHEKSETFSTAADNQTSVEVHVVQGEREMAKDNKSLGRFILDGIASAPRGMPQIEVTFKIDANGILNVTAKDKSTGKEQHITITASSGLSDDEISRMVDEAKHHAESDKQRKEAIDAKNNLDSQIYQTEKMVNENKDKIPADQLGELEKALADAKAVLENTDKNILEQASQSLMQVSQKVAQEIYSKQAGAQPGAEGFNPGAAADAAGASEAPSNDPNVVDAEFEETPKNQ